MIMDEEEKRKKARLEISKIDNKIQQYNLAKTNVQDVQTKCTTTLENISFFHTCICRDSNLVQVKQIDIFEGEMAEKTGQIVAEKIQNIQQIITTTKQLESELINQVSRINTQVDILRNQRAYWSTYL